MRVIGEIPTDSRGLVALVPDLRQLENYVKDMHELTTIT
jgi:hypothetical protein